MTVSMPRPAHPLAVLLAVALATGAAGCGRAHSSSDSSPDKPKTGVKGSANAAADLGFPTFATKNTTRLAGADPVADAAAVTQIVYPSTTPTTRPEAVTLVDVKDWRTALAGSVLNAAPLGAPILFTNGRSIPAATAKALNALLPTGSTAAAGVQAIRLGTLAKPGALRTKDVTGKDPFALARSIDAFATAARGKPSTRVLLVTADDPAFAAPAAAWAATSGDPILFTHKSKVPPDTIAAIKAHKKPKIYVLGPSSVITPDVTKQLKGLGRIIRLGGRNPVDNAVKFAMFGDGDFGWAATTPGHGLVMLTTTADPATAAAVAPLSASGTYGPSLLLSSPLKLDSTVNDYLQQLQPGFLQTAARGFYDHAWLVGDTKAITPALQAEIDTDLENKKIDTKTTK